MSGFAVELWSGTFGQQGAASVLRMKLKSTAIVSRQDALNLKSLVLHPIRRPCCCQHWFPTVPMAMLFTFVVYH